MSSIRLLLLSIAAVLFLSLIALAPQAAAQDTGISVVLKVFRIQLDGDKEAVVAADTIKAGEIIEYQARYSNNGTRAVRNLQATLPIPSALEYRPNTARPGNAKASVDGRTFGAIPLLRTVKENGQDKVVAIPYAEYRFLRWSVGALEAGKSVTVSARAKLRTR